MDGRRFQLVFRGLSLDIWKINGKPTLDFKYVLYYNLKRNGYRLCSVQYYSYPYTLQ